MRFLSVVGARPQFVKASALSRVLRKDHEEFLVHTGQHYDHDMSAVFFEQLDIPEPDVNLGVGSGPHGVQTAAMLSALEEVMLAQAPDAVIVFGDTNSTLAGALAAVKLHLPIAHVEAGLRSYNKAMPEEVNRVLADHAATWCFAPSNAAADNLRAEGIKSGVEVVGDIMMDALRIHGERARPESGMPEIPTGYFLATIHRAENTETRAQLSRILQVLGSVPGPVVMPLHPRTQKAISDFGLALPPRTRVLQPVGYLAMLWLEQHARAILTDSGGVQKEAYHFGVPCLTLRGETEWTETVEAGWNFVCGTDSARVAAALRDAPPPGTARPSLYGDGHAAERIVTALSSTRDLAGVG